MPAEVGFGFDCVIKAFRIGRKVCRASYTKGTIIYYDNKENGGGILVGADGLLLH